ncbi:MAG: DNA primase [Actinobacteria bacterium]|nr:DNA primase [Actinomycetota bacterium]
MAGGRIRDEDVTYVRDNSAIDDVVGDFVALKSAGGGAKKGLCPFHDEKSPSFTVTPSKGFFHCFGCGVGGDVIAFLMKIDHLSFMESIEKLADRMNYTLHYDGVSDGKPSGPAKSRLVAANAAAAAFYQEQLNLPIAQHGRDFLQKRGFDRAAAEQFGIGYAPDEWDGLFKRLKSDGFSDAELSAAGLTKEGTKGPIDRYRNRLVWPIKNITGDYVGFGARKLASDEVDQGPKYLNTSETPLYKKSQILYGLDMAKKEIVKKRQVVIVEGYTDVMAAHLAGVTTAVATCGTAFGAEHIKIIRQLLMDDATFRGEVIFTFDGDAAGQKAALKAFELEQNFVTQTFVAVEPSGMDPCDLRVASGDLAVRDLIARRVPLFEFAIRTEIAKYDINSAEGRVSALNQVAPIVAKIRDASLRPEYVKLVSGWLGLDTDTVGAAVKKSAANLKKFDNQGAQETEPVAPTQEVNLKDPKLILEREVLKIKLQHSDIPNAWDELEPNAFSYWAYHQLRTEIDALESFDLKALIENSPSEEIKSLITELVVEPIRTDREITDHYIRSVFARLREVAITRSIVELKATLQRLNPVENVDQYQEIFTSLVALEGAKRAQKELSLGDLG